VQGAGIVLRDKKGKTALDIATEKEYELITQVLKDRAEELKIICSISSIDLNSESEGGNVECLQRKVNNRNNNIY